MQNMKRKEIIIVGGGTAGWMTANILAHSFKEANVSISLIESENVPVIGVGEGSTPALRNFFDLLNIRESDWMPACNATHKTGIQFDNWSTVKGYQKYFHSFPSMVDQQTQNHFIHNAQLRAAGINLPANPSDFYLAAKIAQENKKPLANDNFPFEIDYAYHFDSNLLGKFLQNLAVNSSVNHVIGHVNDCKINSNNDIEYVVLEDDKQIHGDLFIDCSGFKGILINRLQGVEFVSYEKELFNDAAIAISTPLSSDSIKAQTKSTALKYGWAWQIPLSNRIGNGYVYSSKYVNKESAEQEFKEFLQVDGKELSVRHLSFKLGRLNKHWQGNCLAVGLSQGFIEPLEATALLLIQQTVGKFVDAYQQGNFNSQHRDNFNQQINNDFDGIKDYIVLHYTLNSRQDTEYWCDNRDNLAHMSNRLQQLILGWQTGRDISKLVVKLGLHNHYPISSWYAILAGYGYFPSDLRATEQSAYIDVLPKTQEFLRRCALNFPRYNN